ncbi:YcxB family protein [Aureliella helgolandensis]|uniref:YcxB-like C-terminal domain-containing protein n=1 Tax=Aureliella helgolandensis TaxID=2527968 RepID=A0A518G2R1_9BACT|nr:YcxB family protein [Aureliella helgolandensis]QDV22897.1 hypothetical protein Q31a_11900 [Aureliella helgolandensis]
MTEEIRVSYRLSLSEFMRACEAHWRAQRQGTVSNAIAGALALATGIGLWFFNWFWLALTLAILGCALLGLIGIRQVLWRKAFRDARKYHGEISVSFSNDGVHVETLEGKSDLNWGFFSWYLDTPEHVLLYMTKRTFSVIPRSAFSETRTEDAFRLLVTSKLPVIR